MAKSKAYTVRISERGSRIIEASVAQGGFTRAEILRRAFWHYASTDPDNALSPPDEGHDFTKPEESNGNPGREQCSIAQTGPKHSATKAEGKESKDAVARASTTDDEELLKCMYDPLSESDDV